MYLYLNTLKDETASAEGLAEKLGVSLLTANDVDQTTLVNDYLGATLNWGRDRVIFTDDPTWYGDRANHGKDEAGFVWVTLVFEQDDALSDIARAKATFKREVIDYCDRLLFDTDKAVRFENRSFPAFLQQYTYDALRIKEYTGEEYHGAISNPINQQVIDFNATTFADDGWWNEQWYRIIADTRLHESRDDLMAERALENYAKFVLTYFKNDFEDVKDNFTPTFISQYRAQQDLERGGKSKYHL